MNPGESELFAGALEYARHLLPAQSPLERFVHHNTLHAFEFMPFEEAVVAAGNLYGAEAFLPEVEYRRLYSEGRIREVDLGHVLSEEVPGEELYFGIGRRQLARALMVHHIPEVDVHEVDWMISEGDVLTLARGDLSRTARVRFLNGYEGLEPFALRTLLSICRDRAKRLTWELDGDEPRRHNDDWQTNEWVNPMLIRWCGAFLDQGVSYWPMSDRQDGFFWSFLDQAASRPAWARPWTFELARLARDEKATQLDARRFAIRSLRIAGVPPDRWPEFVAGRLLQLPGWAGMFSMLETRPEQAPAYIGPVRLEEVLAVRLLMDRAAIEWKAAFPTTNAASARAVPHEPQVDVGFVLFNLCQVLGLTPTHVRGASIFQIQGLLSAYRSFGEIERRRLWHLAYERRHAVETLDGLRAHVRSCSEALNHNDALAQVVCCIDDREESFRRHLEEIEPRIETFGAAGHFGIAMEYLGLGEPVSEPLCPATVRPSNFVREVQSEMGSGETRQVSRATRTWHEFRMGASETLIRGSLFAISGMSAVAPMAAQLLRPRLHVRMNSRGSEHRTHLDLEPSGTLSSGLKVGFELGEMADIVGGQLRSMGLTQGFAPLVLIIGHGSHSVNNPHFAAYNCGACAGGRGGPNARAFAAMANEPEVRSLLARSGIDIPSSVRFVGGYHDTSDDELTVFDVDLLPAERRTELDQLKPVLEAARRRDAHERCRSFASASLRIDEEAALHHAEERSHDLAQPRPELGHARNSLCIVGRRALTRGLFLDRRAFLTSYDPRDDLDSSVLAGVLSTVLPVCGGINLEYYFSRVDRNRYGAGTKLPHNISGLLGVMDGHASDLRTGLPWQMVEIHEAVRLLTIVEGGVEHLERALRLLSPDVLQLVTNGWTRIASVDAGSGEVHIYRHGGFQPHDPESSLLQTAATSRDWYQGHRDSLPPARIASSRAGEAA